MRKTSAHLAITAMLAVAACTPLPDSAPAKPAPVYIYGTERGAGSIGSHLVQGGDTFDSIAKRYDVTVEDLIAVNKLKSGDVVKSGSRLLLPRPRNYQVREGDTARSVAKMFELSPADLGSANKLSGPYVLAPGQTLALPRQQLDNLIQKALAKPLVLPKQKPPLPALKAAPTLTASAAKPEPKLGGPHVLQLPEGMEAQQTASQRAMPGQKHVLVVPESYRPPATPPVAVVDTPAPMNRSAPEPAPAAPASAPASVQQASLQPVPRGDGFMVPVQGKVVSTYGTMPDGRRNDGVNIAAAAGTPVQAAKRGRVVFAGDDIAGYGNMVLVQHTGQYVTVYAHLDRVMVRKGDAVEKGDMLGTVGKTGAVSTPQLHFEVRQGKGTKNPAHELSL